MSQSDQVRAAADIVKIVGDYVKLRKAGANYIGLCPFHSEKSPSFSVHPIKQFYHCFGCGAGGDVFKFVMQIDSLTFREALQRVAEKVGVQIDEHAGADTYDPNTKLRASLTTLHEAAAKYFAAQLGATTEGRSARSYLSDRGITDEVVGRFRLGFAPGDGQGLVHHFNGGEFDKETLEQSGLILVNAERQRPYDRFRRRIIFPIANDSGKVVAFAGRALGDEQPKYLNSPETPIYTKSRLLYHLDRAAQAMRKLDYAILVEGYMDCIAVAAIGIENVVASCGTSLTEGQIRLLGRYTRRAVVNYDPDSAGIAATERSLALLLEAGFEARVLSLPGGLDPDAFIRKRGPAEYSELLKRAPSYLDYLTERAAKNHDIQSPEGKVAAVNAVLPYLVKVPNPILRNELSQRLAERLRVDERLLRGELQRAAGEKRGEVRVVAEPASELGLAVKQLLRACLESDALLDTVLPEIISSGVVTGLTGENIFKQLWEARQRNKKLDIQNSEGVLSPQEKRLALDALFWRGAPTTLEEAQGYLRALKFSRLQREKAEVQRQIEVAAKSNDASRLTELQRAKSHLDKELRGLGRS